VARLLRAAVGWDPRLESDAALALVALTTAFFRRRRGPPPGPAELPGASPAERVCAEDPEATGKLVTGAGSGSPTTPVAGAGWGPRVCVSAMRQL
jgi:MYXO-CTERM domain-containing protein